MAGRIRGRDQTGRGCLFVVSTPIGNLSDLTERACLVLAQSDHIVAEDTRRARVLLNHAGISARPMSLHAHNEATRVPRVLSWLSRGHHVALVSDAGTPLLSDPGERVVRAAIQEDHDVIPIPGVSAVLTALVASGFSCVPFAFRGFLPRRGKARSLALKCVAHAKETTVLFESSRRVTRLLGDLEIGLASPAGSNRRVAVCREMTKAHEEVVRGTAARCKRHFDAHPPRGEVTVVVEGLGTEPTKWGEVGREVEAALDDGLAPTAAARRVAGKTGISRGEAYDAVMARRRVSSGKEAGPGSAQDALGRGVST